MITRIAAAALTAAFALTAGSASAITLTDGEIACENQNQVKNNPGDVYGFGVFDGSFCDELIKPELPNGVGPEIEFDLAPSESAHILGWVADQAGDTINFKDNARFKGSTEYVFEFTLLDPSSGFSADVSLDGIGSQTVDGSNLTATFTGLLSSTAKQWSVDAALTTGDRKDSHYKITVSAVPVPAGVLMLMSAFGIAAGVKRARRAA